MNNIEKSARIGILSAKTMVNPSCILSATEIYEHRLFHTVRESYRSKFNPTRANGAGMDEVESNEEALVSESYEAFIKIKEEPDPGTFPLIFGLVFMILIPLFSFDFYGDNTLCCGSFLIGFVILGVGAIQSSAQGSRYKKATKDLARTAGIPKKMAYPFFSLQAADKRINSLVLQKYPFLSQPKQNSTKTKPPKIVLEQREEE